jgi:hypothetical protein
MIADLWRYEIDSVGQVTKFRVRDRASPLGRLFLGTLKNFLEGRDDRPQLMALAYPVPSLAAVPIVAFLLARAASGDVLVSTRSGFRGDPESPFERHRRVYSLLANGPAGDIFASYVAPAGVIVNDELVFSARIPLAKQQWFREAYIRTLRARFREGSPKVIFSKDLDLRRLKQVKGVLEGPKGAESLGIQPVRLRGLIIEGADTLLSSPYRLREFMEWIGGVRKGNLKIFLFYSNPWSPVLDPLRRDYRAEVLRFTPQFLQINRAVLAEEPNGPLANSGSATDALVLDSPTDYRYSREIVISKPLFRRGNLDSRYLEIMQLLSRIGTLSSAPGRGVYARIFKFARNFLSLISAPSDLKVAFPDLKDGSYIVRGVEQLLEEGRRLAKQVGGEQGLLINRLCNELESGFIEMEGLRYAIGQDPSAMNKLDRVIETSQTIGSQLIVAPFLNEDAGFIKFSKFGSSNGNQVSIIPIEHLVKKWFDRKGMTLVVPGPVSWRFWTELLRPYQRIIFLSYEGSQEIAVRDQISILSDVTAQDYWKCLISIRRANQVCNGRFEEVIRSAEDALRGIVSTVQLEVSKKGKKAITVDELMTQLAARTQKATRPRAMDKIEEGVEATSIQGPSESLTLVPTIEVLAREREGGQVARLTFRLDRTVLYTRPRSEDILEVFPSELETGGVVVIIDDDERKTLLDLVIELYDLDEPVDAELIAGWKNILAKYVAGTGENKKGIYDEYVQAYKSGAFARHPPRTYATVCTWLRGEVIAPEDSDDLVALAKVVGSTDLAIGAESIVAEADKVRALHVKVGLKLRSIIRALLEGREVSDLSYEELMLRSKIRLLEVVQVPQSRQI